MNDDEPPSTKDKPADDDLSLRETFEQLKPLITKLIDSSTKTTVEEARTRAILIVCVFLVFTYSLWQLAEWREFDEFAGMVKFFVGAVLGLLIGKKSR